MKGKSDLFFGFGLDIATRNCFDMGLFGKKNGKRGRPSSTISQEPLTPRSIPSQKAEFNQVSVLEQKDLVRDKLFLSLSHPAAGVGVFSPKSIHDLDSMRAPQLTHSLS